MSIATVTAALQARHLAVAGVRTAPVHSPDSVPGANLPCVLVDALPGETRWRSHAGNVYATRRTYRVRGLIKEAGTGTGIFEAREQAATILDAVLTALVAAPELTSAAAIVVDEPGALRDSGVLPHPGSDNAVVHGASAFVGFTLDVVIDERVG